MLTAFPENGYQPKPSKVQLASRIGAQTTFQTTYEDLYQEHKKGSRISVFVDGSNLFYLQKDALGWWIDLRKVLDYLAKFGDVVDAAIYSSVDPNSESQRAQLKSLAYAGFRVEKKFIKPFTDKDGNIAYKANMDVDIAVDMFNQIENYDTAVLVSGDGDFARALQILHARGKQFKVLSTSKFLSHELRSIAGMHYTDFQNIRNLVERY